MTPNRPTDTRRKAVWGPKRTLAMAILAIGLASSAMAEGPHRATAPTTKPGMPHSSVRGYKLDKELTKRSSKGNPLFTSSVIVRLDTGAKLPPQFKKYLRGGSLDLINGVVLELPNGALKQLAAHPDVFSVHENRPIKTHNYRTSVTVGARTVQ